MLLERLAVRRYGVGEYASGIRVEHYAQVSQKDNVRACGGVAS